LAAGACGLTVAKVGEAEALLPAFDGGLADILVAYPTVDPARTQRLAMLGRAATVRVALDTIDAIDAVAAAAQAAGVTIGVLVDLDVGKGRTGVPTAERLANLAQAAPLATVASKLQEAIDLFDRHGLCREVVSGGSTPTAFQSHLVPHEGPDHLVGKLPVVVHQRPAVVVARPDRPAICTSSPACSIVRYH
jgi:D-serine deaminase-like pyridoxal phosphate-dependent protein